MSSWEPLIADADPALARRAQEIVDATAGFLQSCAGDADGPHARVRRAAQASSPGLQPFLDRLTGSEGVPAVPLFFAYLALERGGTRSLDATWTWLDRAVEVTSSHEDLGPWLFTGAAGCAWVIAHVLRHASGARSLVDDRSTEDVDAMLAELLAAYRGSIDPDIATGLSGIGTYYLETLPRESSTAGLESVLEQLRDRAEHRPGGITWRKAPLALSRELRLVHPEGLHNLGMPHGVPGVVAFLARVCASEASSPVARELLEGAVSWLLAQKMPCGASIFPYFVDPARGPVADETRLSWCYGDLGIASALLQAARAMNRGDWELEALTLAEHAASRSREGSGVVDGIICHGAAGIAHVFNRLYQASGRPALRSAALRWYRATVDYYDPSSGPTGYRCLLRGPHDAAPEGRPERPPDSPIESVEYYGVAVGVVGVALALLAGLGRVPPDWDRLLATPVRPVGPARRRVDGELDVEGVHVF